MAPRMGPMRWQEDLDELAAAEAQKMEAPELLGPVSSAYTDQHENGRLLPTGIRKPLPSSSTTPKDPALWGSDASTVAPPYDPDPDLTRARESDANRRIGADIEKIGRIWSGGDAMVRPADAVARLMASREKTRKDALETQKAAKAAKQLEAYLAAQQARDRQAQETLDETRRHNQVVEEQTAEDKKFERGIKTGHLSVEQKNAETARLKAEAEVAKEKAKQSEGLAAGWEMTGETNPDKVDLRKHSDLQTASTKMKGLTKEMRSLLASTGAFERFNPLTQRHAELDQLATMIGTEGKNVAGLGALSGPDMELMLSIAANPTSIFTAGKDMNRMLDRLDAWGDNSVNAMGQTLGLRRKGSAPAAGQAPQPQGDQVEIVMNDGRHSSVSKRSAELLIKAGKAKPK